MSPGCIFAIVVKTLTCVGFDQWVKLMKKFERIPLFEVEVEFIAERQLLDVDFLDGVAIRLGCTVENCQALKNDMTSPSINFGFENG